MCVATRPGPRPGLLRVVRTAHYTASQPGQLRMGDRHKRPGIHRLKFHPPCTAWLSSAPGKASHLDLNSVVLCPHGHRGDPALVLLYKAQQWTSFPVPDHSFFIGLPMRLLPFYVQLFQPNRRLRGRPRTSPHPCRNHPPVHLFSISGPFWSGSVSTCTVVWSLHPRDKSLQP